MARALGMRGRRARPARPPGTPPTARDTGRRRRLGRRPARRTTGRHRRRAWTLVPRASLTEADNMRAVTRVAAIEDELRLAAGLPAGDDLRDVQAPASYGTEGQQ